MQSQRSSCRSETGLVQESSQAAQVREMEMLLMHNDVCMVEQVWATKSAVGEVLLGYGVAYACGCELITISEQGVYSCCCICGSCGT